MKSSLQTWSQEIKVLEKCNRALGGGIDYLFVMHWFRRGGSELETLLLIRSLRRLRPELRLGLVTTLNVPSEWEHLLPREVKRAHFGQLAAGFSRARKRKLLLKLLEAQAPQVIHNVISDTCWDVFVSDSERLAARSTLLASSFCVNYPRKKPEAFVLSHFPRCKAPPKAILVDNRRHAHEILGVKKSAQVHALRFPVHNAFVRPRRPTAPRRRLKLLWAGRMDYQKRIDILYLVALLNPEHSFHVWGQFVSDRPNSFFDLAKLKGLSNVTLHREYDRIEQIPFRSFDAFLYTSAWDGMPNILIEIASKGLPVIAPDVGGIRELITKETGYLVSHPNAVGEYSRILGEIATNPGEAWRRARNAQAYLKTRHSLRQFEDQLDKILRRAGV